MSRVTDDSTLDDMANGELTDDELGFLAALAEGDPEAEAELEAARPLDADARARIADGLVASMDRAAEPATAPTPIRKSDGRRRWVLGAATVALAAAAALAVVPTLTEPALPPFELQVSGQQSASRAAPGPTPANDPVELAPEGTLELVLRPAEPTSFEAALFLERGGRLLPIDEPFERAESGALRWRVPAEVLGAPGERASVVVAYDAETPSPENARDWLAEADPRARRTRVVVGARAR